MRASVFAATTLDGYIARADGGLDWLVSSDAGTGDYGFHEFMDSVDVLVMGRATFEVARTADEWPYGHKPVIVLTHRDLDLPPGFPGRVESRSSSLEDLTRELSARGLEQVYVDGGQTIQAFLRAGLVGRIIITQLPVLIGSGIPMFGSLETDVALRLVRTSSYDNGWLQMEYEVIPAVTGAPSPGNVSQ